MSVNPSTVYKADTIDLVALWRVLWAYKYVIVLVAGLSSITAVALALTATPIFRAEVVVVPTRQGSMGRSASLVNRLGGLANLAGIDLSGNNDATADALAVLKSRNLIQRFIERQKLLPVMYPGSKTTPSLWRAVNRFQRSILSIRSDAQLGTTTIAVNWRVPAVAAKWANDFVALANETIRSDALHDAKRNIGYLSRQLDQTNVVELRKVLYDLIEGQTQTMMLANARTDYAFTIVDPAVPPESRISPRRTLMVLTGGALGLVLGVVIAFVLNAFAWSRASIVEGGHEPARTNSSAV